MAGATPVWSLGLVCEDGGARYLTELFAALEEEGDGPSYGAIASPRRATAWRNFNNHRRGVKSGRASRAACATCARGRALPWGIKGVRALCHAVRGDVSQVTEELLRTLPRVKLERDARYWALLF